ncbi:MAG: transporter [Sulfurimonas sp.]|nr:transporter [Sulfurimonas sp.]
MKKTVVVSSILFATIASAHHGVAALGIAGLEGPGAPLETTSSQTLPEGKFLAYMRAEHISYNINSSAYDEEMQKHEYFTYMLGYGVTSYFNLYMVVPYFTKMDERGVGTAGFHDLKFSGVLGFKYDEGVSFVPNSESLDDLEDWHFTANFSVSLPTGDSNLRNPDGDLYDYGSQLSFAAPSYMLGLSATKWFGANATIVFDASYNTFMEGSYSDGARVKFGDEMRANTALSYKLYSDDVKKLRIDANIEANYLNLGRDALNGVDEIATGGEVLYNTVGARVFYKNISVAAGVKIPTWKSLNEESQQQGAEGNEKYRAIFSFSALF